MRNLPQGMDTGIRSASTAHAHRLSGELPNGADKLALDRDTIGLDLPADKRRAFIFEGNAIAGIPATRNGSPAAQQDALATQLTRSARA